MYLYHELNIEYKNSATSPILFTYNTYYRLPPDAAQGTELRISSSKPNKMATKTRSQKKADHPKLYDLLGVPKDLLESELPTLRQCLQYAMLLDDRSVTKLSLRGKFTLVGKKLLEIWHSVNPQLPIFAEKSVVNRLMREWGKARDLSHRPKSDARPLVNFKAGLDRLFDICQCRCVITECSEFDGCDGCEFEAHVACSCNKNSKIPTRELKFMSVQRRKIGEKSSMQIGSKDYQEAKRQERYQKRKN